ncbi:MAG: type II toxin-antitoxin system VapC family toxin [SAR324 cluster bacterium]|nr:type II toxin-antitoxin system VapC family toxin [SAR324 cluster bacterium]
MASVWEMIIKAQLGKLEMEPPYHKFIIQKLQEHAIELAPLQGSELVKLELLPAIHKDPFDRILVCQSLEYDLFLVTDDSSILQYPAHFLH